MTFRAILANRATDGAVTTSVDVLDDRILNDGDVKVAVEWSNVNYKDAVAILTPRIIKSFPLVPGIDFAGTVASSRDGRFKVGDKVVATGWGLSQDHHGGYAQQASVKGDWLVKLPGSISTRDAMAIGTAGFTAMLSVLALEQSGINPERGDILVTGASGGVGSVSIAILAELGYRVTASSGKSVEADYLKSLGASEVMDRALLSEDGPPLGADRWAGAVDAVGGKTLVNILSQTKYRGAVTTCGFVGGMELPASILPFILRGITLCGIDSVNAPQSLREVAWKRLATDLDLRKLGSMVSEVGLNEVRGVAENMLQGKVRGRTLVDVNR
ncbi:MDR family oxidoreductase [Rhizobium leguminosarum]|uniref:MDR family oxidoreductase n=1 Tax=Rhizobium leguminosarum TaxID=384 RepID=UPI00103EC003|nr:MDR family oxidoreductase [Rhizobium leguminosarum]TBY43748.1 oxidoreductase [Rhizobium leguminosarum bv. viciae]